MDCRASLRDWMRNVPLPAEYAHPVWSKWWSDSRPIEKRRGVIYGASGVGNKGKRQREWGEIHVLRKSRRFFVLSEPPFSFLEGENHLGRTGAHPARCEISIAIRRRKQKARAHAKIVFEFPRKMRHLFVSLVIGNFLDRFTRQESLV